MEIEFEGLNDLIEKYAEKQSPAGQKAISKLAIMSQGKYVSDVSNFPFSAEVLKLVNTQIAQKIETIKLYKEHLLVRCHNTEEFMVLYEFVKAHSYTGFNNEVLSINPKNNNQESRLYHVLPKARKIDLTGTSNFFIDSAFKYATRLDSVEDFKSLLWFEERK